MEHETGSRTEKGSRLYKRDVTKPNNGVLSCFDGHVTPHREQPELKPLSSTKFQRWYMADGVKRIPVKEGRIRGTLFLPPGEGPFPGRYRLFSLSRNKNINWKPSSGRSQENECYKRLIYRQFVQVSGLNGSQFLSYLPKRFTHLCRAL